MEETIKACYFGVEIPKHALSLSDWTICKFLIAVDWIDIGLLYSGCTQTSVEGNLNFWVEFTT